MTSPQVATPYSSHTHPEFLGEHRPRSISDASDAGVVYDPKATPPMPTPPHPIAATSQPGELARRKTHNLGRPRLSAPSAVSSSTHTHEPLPHLHHHPQSHQRRISSGSSASSSRSRSPLAQLVHPALASPPFAARDSRATTTAAASLLQQPQQADAPEPGRRAPGETGFGGDHVLMRVQHGEGFEYSKEFLAAKYECQYCGKRFNRPSSLKVGPCHSFA